MINRCQVGLILITVFLFLNNYNPIKDKPVQVWGHQFGSPNHDVSRSIVADNSGNAYITGCTSGKIGDKSFGGRDAFVAKYNSTGNILWIRQLGTIDKDNAIHITFKKGYLYICGETSGKLGDKHAGGKDAFFSKLDIQGNLLWTAQFGTNADDVAKKIISDDSNNLYLTGFTQGTIGEKHYGKKDAYVCKYNPSGDLIWKTQIGTPADDRSGGIAIDQDGNIYIAGDTKGRLGKTHFGDADIFMAKLNAKGTVLWIQQYGTSAFDGGTGIVVDKKGYLYLSGGTGGNLSGKQRGKGDAFVLRCNSDGSIIWKQQFGTTLWDLPWGMILCKDGPNDIIIGGCQHYYPCQAFLRRYDDKGNPGFICEIIKEKKGYGVCGKNISMDELGNYYITGGTREDLFDTHKGNGDIFVAKYRAKTPSSFINKN